MVENAVSSSATCPGADCMALLDRRFDVADDLALVPPLGINASAWIAITSHRDRLKTAMDSADGPLILGRSKELAECVARVIIDERGQVAPAMRDFPSLIDSSHGFLQRQPGADLSDDPSLRTLVQGAMKIIKCVGEIRNSFGSGHGRAREPLVQAEMVDVAVAATMLWVRWALGRLAPLILGQPSSLIADLLDGASFYKGNLAERLRAANLSVLDSSIQQKLGNAVARRAMRQTVNVRVEGVEPSAVSDSLTDWPLYYRRGLIDGLLFDDNGNARTTRWALELVPGILRATEDQSAELERVLLLIANMTFETGDYAEDYALWTSALNLKDRFELTARPNWSMIADRFDPGLY